jgi:HTH-type transcriptional regulator/antitoxin HigA
VVFAQTIERPVQFVSELLNGKRELTADTARRLEAALDIPAGFWLRYEAEYRLTKSSLDPELATRIREKALAW